MRADGVRVFVRRERDGGVSLASLIRAPAPPMPLDAAASASASRMAISNRIPRDRQRRSPPRRRGGAAPHRTRRRADCNSISRTCRAIRANRLGSNSTGRSTARAASTSPAPPCRHRSRPSSGWPPDELDLAALDPYVSDMLNTTISSAALTMNGALALATARDKLRVSYRGDATLGNVHMLDRATSESILRWHSCSASRHRCRDGVGSAEGAYRRARAHRLRRTPHPQHRRPLERLGHDGEPTLCARLADPHTAGVWRPDASQRPALPPRPSQDPSTPRSNSAA